MSLKAMPDNQYPLFTVPRRILDLPNMSLQKLRFFEIVWSFYQAEKICYMSNEKIMERLGISDRGLLNRLIQYFEQHGELKRIYLHPKGQKKPTRALLTKQQSVVLCDYDRF